MKKALVIGINRYDHFPSLTGCVRDAVGMATVLKVNGDESPNFDVTRITSDDCTVSASLLERAMNDLFEGDSETVLFYFSGHGSLDQDLSNGYLVAEDGNHRSLGISLRDLIAKANAASPKVKSTVIILDCCHLGTVAETSVASNDRSYSELGQGVTLLSAGLRDGVAEEDDQGKFTEIMIECLQGAASSIIGKITPASLYAHIEQIFDSGEQRPIYKANVQQFTTLRDVTPKVPLELLRKLPTYFPNQNDEYQLDPSYEPDRGEETERLKEVPVVMENVEIYRNLQKCNQQGIVTPTKYPFMWHSAVYSSSVKLTAIGAFYWRMAVKGRF